MRYCLWLPCFLASVSIVDASDLPLPCLAFVHSCMSATQSPSIFLELSGYANWYSHSPSRCFSLLFVAHLFSVWIRLISCAVSTGLIPIRFTYSSTFSTADRLPLKKICDCCYQGWERWGNCSTHLPELFCSFASVAIGFYLWLLINFIQLYRTWLAPIPMRHTVLSALYYVWYWSPQCPADSHQTFGLPTLSVSDTFTPRVLVPVCTSWKHSNVQRLVVGKLRLPENGPIQPRLVSSIGSYYSRSHEAVAASLKFPYHDFPPITSFNWCSTHTYGLANRWSYLCLEVRSRGNGYACFDCGYALVATHSENKTLRVVVVPAQQSTKDQ